MLLAYGLYTGRFARQYFPVVTANCFRTSDGRWVQLLGVDLPRHLPKLVRVLGIQASLYPRCAQHPSTIHKGPVTSSTSLCVCVACTSNSHWRLAEFLRLLL